MLVLYTQLVYLTLSVAMTIYVARSLHKQGRIFLLKTFAGEAELADSVNHLLLVGFYLINLGWVILWTTHGVPPQDYSDSTAFVTTKFGTVMLILGVVHFGNLIFLWKIQKRGVKAGHQGPPPLPSPEPNAGIVA